MGADSVVATGKFVVFLLLLLVALASCNSMDRNEKTPEERESDCLSYKDTATHQDTYNYRLYHYILYAGNPKDDVISENKYSEILFDSNDSLLMQMDTVLEFSSCQELYRIFIRKDKTGRMVLEYKIVLGKCLFAWMPYAGWASIPCGREGDFVASDDRNGN